MKKTIPILINDLAGGIRTDETDVLVQAEAVQKSLDHLGYAFRIVPFTERMEDLKYFAGSPDVKAAFNLVEAVRGENALQYLAPLALERLGVPFTGNSAKALRRTTDKILAKRIMNIAGVPTPPHLSTAVKVPGPKGSGKGRKREWIFKPVLEDASVGIPEDLIGPYPEREALDILALLERETGMPYMAEEFIHGREFNISLIESAGSPAVFPPVEQDFSLLPASTPRVVGYRAKWVEDSVEYSSIPRRYAFQMNDRALLDEIRQVAINCWKIFGLSGYARVDLRVDEKGRLFVLEINANPCLSPDAGFAFAAGLAGLTMDDLVLFLLDAAVSGTKGKKIPKAG